MMNDDALAPVIAVMLILAIGVTVFAVYTSTYLPGLKQQAEVEHFKEVESGFTKFSSDIDNAIGTGNENVTFSEQVPLGGGDILVNSMQSSGTIQIRSENLGYFNITNSTTPGHYTNTTVPLEMVDFSYQPDGNFWLNQSYTWQYGYVNVTKGDRETPLQYDMVTDPSFNSALNQFTGNLVRYYPKTNDINNGTLQIVCINTSANNIISSNGMARLKTLDTERYQQVSK